MALKGLGKGRWVVAGILLGFVTALVVPGLTLGEQVIPCPQSITQRLGPSAAALSIAAPPRVMAPCPGFEWAKTYGGAGSDVGFSVREVSTGGFIVVGTTGSFGAGDDDVWVLRLDYNGAVVWQRTYGGTGKDWGFSVQETPDGGFVVAGWTESFSARRSAWVLRLDGVGTVLWQRVFAGPFATVAEAIDVTSEGGFVFTGLYTSSSRVNARDAWVVRLDSSGNILWQRTYGGNKEDWGHSIQQTADGGYVVAARTQSFGAGFVDLWVLKLDSLGAIFWQRTYGGKGEDGRLAGDMAPRITQTSDGGYAVAGTTESFGAGASDAWVLKLDSSGNIQWQRTYGGMGYEQAGGVQETAEGGYAVAGRTDSFGAGSADLWLLKLDASGNVIWQKTYGGASAEWGVGLTVRQTSEFGYVMTAASQSFGDGSADLWVLKVDTNGNIPACPLPLGVDSSGTADISPGSSTLSRGATRSPSVSVIVTSANPADSAANIATQCAV